MATIPRGKTDDDVQQIRDWLTEYEKAHPEANAEVYRQNSASIRIRIVDPRFAALDRVERHDQLRRELSQLPEDVQQQISLLLLLPPAELRSSLASLDFDDPLPSTL
jgi:stress-induced morphogen